ncbi:hypothetical protein NXV35_25435 [Bacteroides faecis]|nr:hypothetical protein [Bacteroides faecis]
MNTQDIKVNGQHFILVTMKDDVASLDEVVVVGYGTQKRGEYYRSHIYSIRQRIVESSLR